MNAEDEIVQLIEGMAGKYSPYVIFADWVKMYAIAIQNACSMQDKAWQAAAWTHLIALVCPVLCLSAGKGGIRMNLEQITVQDCIELMEKKDKRVLIEDGQVVAITK